MKKKKSRLTWLRWTVRRAGIDRRSHSHAFIVGRDGKRAPESLCGYACGKTDVEIVADAGLTKCSDCDYVMREPRDVETL